MRPTLFAAGFRVFFLLTALYGAVSVAAWGLMFQAGVATSGPLTSNLWHGHEMIFGFALGAIGGFLLTAVPNWTSTPPVSGWPLAILALLWLAGRGVFWLELGGMSQPLITALVDLSFLPALGLAVGQQILSARNKRNYIFLAFLTLIFLGNLLIHLDLLGVLPGVANKGLYLGLYVVLIIVVLISGRVVPAFTSGGLRMSGRSGEDVRTDPRVEKAVLVSVIIAMLAGLALGDGPLFGGLSLLAGGFLVLRMWHWKTWRILDIPLVWVLHLGHGWLAAGFLIIGLAELTGALPLTSSTHALTAGAIGTMILAVASRASLGHSGREMKAPRFMPWAYLLVSLGALIRVLAPLFQEWVDYGTAIAASGVVWALAYAIFVAIYLPVWISPRADGRPG